MNIFQPRHSLLFVSGLGFIVVVTILVSRSSLFTEIPHSSSGSNALDAARPAPDAGPAEPNLGPLNTGQGSPSSVTSDLTQAERDRVDAEIQKVRDLMHELDRQNSQTLRVNGRLAFKLHALTEEQLDLMYNALTKAAATFESGSAGEKVFRDDALKVIDDFRSETMNDSTGKLTLLMAARDDQQFPSALVLSTDAVITEKPGGEVEVNASEATHNSFKDWNDPDSKSRRRYGHLLEGR